MQKLLLTLTILIGAHSLHGMEMQKLSPITLPQIYYYLSDALSKDVAQLIFELDPGTSMINDAFDEINRMPTSCMYMTLKDDGHCLAVEMLKRKILRENKSFRKITNNYVDNSLLYFLGILGSSNVAKLFLEVADNDILPLLTYQSSGDKQTVLHLVSEKGLIEFVKLLLDAAVNHVQDFVNMPDKYDKTAFDIATPEIKEVMLPYLQKNQ